jgi:hypothetical protein
MRSCAGESCMTQERRHQNGRTTQTGSRKCVIWGTSPQKQLPAAPIWGSPWAWGSIHRSRTTCTSRGGDRRSPHPAHDSGTSRLTGAGCWKGHRHHVCISNPFAPCLPSPTLPSPIIYGSQGASLECCCLAVINGDHDDRKPAFASRGSTAGFHFLVYVDSLRERLDIASSGTSSSYTRRV